MAGAAMASKEAEAAANFAIWAFSWAASLAGAAFFSSARTPILAALRRGAMATGLHCTLEEKSDDDDAAPVTAAVEETAPARLVAAMSTDWGRGGRGGWGVRRPRCSVQMQGGDGAEAVKGWPRGATLNRECGIGWSQSEAWASYLDPIGRPPLATQCPPP
jgi:hypothetical protein